MGSKALKRVAPILGAVAGSFIPGIGTAIGSSIGAAAGTKVAGGSWGQALKAGLFNYAGAKIGGYVGNTGIGRSAGLGNTVGTTVGSTAKNAIGPEFLDTGLNNVIGDSVANHIGATLANTSLGTIAGQYAGNALSTPAPKVSGPAPFNPKQQDQQDLPDSLSSFGSLTPEQQSSNIATKGVYGGGNGPQENSYFLNLINRRLVDQSGHVDQNLSDVNPIENSYLSNLGLGGYGNTKSLLEAISKWKQA